MTTPVELRVTVRQEDADVIGDALWLADPSAIEERTAPAGQIVLVAGFANRGLADRATVALAGLGQGRPYGTDVVEITDDSWLDRWKSSARPVDAGRFTIVPAWIDTGAVLPPAGSERHTMTLRLDPGRAFGSGSHPTTRLMLRAVDQCVTSRSAVLDVGCGSGVLAVAAAALGASPVVAVDVDPAAVSATLANAQANGVADRVVVSLDPLRAVEGTFDIVLANLSASTIEDLGSDLVKRVAPAGRLVLSGLLADRWRPTVEHLTGWSVSAVADEDGWVAVTLVAQGAAGPAGRRSRLAARTSDIEPFRVVEVMERAWTLERSGRSVIRLCVGEPDFGTPPTVIEAARRWLEPGDVHYTSSLGLPPLREAISAYYAERFGLDVAARRIVVTTGASGALLLALAATVDPDDEILLADPGYPCNRHFVRTFEGRAAGVAVGPETAYQLTAALVDQHWTDATRGVLAASPANPTGTTIPPAELASIINVARSRGGVAYVDEIYGELVFDHPAATALSASEDVFVVNSCSKTFGMTGWRVGWLVCPDWALDAVEALAQNLYIAPPAPSQWAARAAFSPEVWDIVADRRSQFRARRDLLVEGLTAIGFGVPVLPDGAFYVYADCSNLADDSSELVTRLLEQAGVAVTPGNDFGQHRAAQHVRFSTTRPADQLSEALDRMARVLGRPASGLRV